jgi:DNA invertase Pin-like site-specific DNA recombinase
MTQRLPRSLGELRGLRARRYVRVSSEEQGWKYGPDGQHLTVDELVSRLGVVETGPAFLDEHSAWSRSGERPALLAMLAAAVAGDLEVVLVPYFSRWSRDTEVALRLRRELHDAGVVIAFADEGFVSSDQDAFDRYLDEAVAAHKFSNRLSRTVARTLEAKFTRFGDQAGSAGFGFLRTPQPEARLAVDPDTMPTAVALFERYALGDVSYRELAVETGVAEGMLRGILSNPLYNGWAVRRRRSADTVRVAAPWRSSPPVSDELWARVVDVRSRRAKAAGRHRSRHIHLLAKRLFCTCGRVVKADTSRQKNGSIVRRYVHQDCDRWQHENIVAHRIDVPITTQLAGLRLDAPVLARIRAMAGQPTPVSTDLRRGQLEHELREKATAHAARRLTTEAYLAEHERISAEIDSLTVAEPGAPVEDADMVIARLRDFRATWATVEDDLAVRAQMVASVYDRITVEDGRIVEVELTESAKRWGFVLALPETVVMARPAGLEQSQTKVRIPIVGRRDWLAATKWSA